MSEGDCVPAGGGLCPDRTPGQGLRQARAAGLGEESHSSFPLGEERELVVFILSTDQEGEAPAIAPLLRNWWARIRAQVSARFARKGRAEVAADNENTRYGWPDDLLL